MATGKKKWKIGLLSPLTVSGDFCLMPTHLATWWWYITASSNRIDKGVVGWCETRYYWWTVVTLTMISSRKKERKNYCIGLLKKAIEQKKVLRFFGCFVFLFKGASCEWREGYYLQRKMGKLVTWKKQKWWCCWSSWTKEKGSRFVVEFCSWGCDCRRWLLF